MQGIANNFAWSTLPDLSKDPTASVAAKVGRRIFNHRRRLHMSQCHLARLSGCTQQTLFDIERGVNGMRMARLFVIAAALRTTASELLEGIS